MQLIPLQPVASQKVSIILNKQLCDFNVYQRFFGLFVDVSVNGTTLLYGVLAENLNRIVRYQYLGFVGDLIFADAIGAEDPDYTGLGKRYEFLYLSPADLQTLGLSDQ